MKKSMSPEYQVLLKNVMLKRAPYLAPQLLNTSLSGISEEDRLELIRIVSLEFNETGLDADEEPNSHGLALEELLDVLNRDRIIMPREGNNDSLGC